MSLKILLWRLPFRLVVNNILCYVEIEIQKCESFDLFGYFKTDRTRKIFYLFQSIYSNLYGTKAKVSVYMNFSKLRSIEVEQINLEIEKTLANNSQNMLNLESLSFRSLYNSNNENNCSNLSNFFEKEEIFPSLRKLRIVLYDLEGRQVFNCSKWSQNTSFWNQLECLNFAVQKDSSVENHIPSIFGKNLRKLYLNIDCGSERKIELDLPNIEELKLPVGEKENVVLKNIGKELKIVITNKPELIRDVFTRNESKIRTIRLCDQYNENNKLRNWLFEHENFQKLGFVNLRKFTFPPFVLFNKNIKRLELGHNMDLEDTLFEKNTFQNLQELRIEERSRTSRKLTLNGKFEWTKNLKILELRTIFNLSDNFFILNVFSNLKKLLIRQSGLWNFNEFVSFPQNQSKKWNYFPRLEKLKFLSIHGINDSFFEDCSNDVFPEIKELIIVGCKKITNFGNCFDFSKINILFFGNCPLLDIDQIMRKNILKKLKSLIISKNGKVTGEGWNELNEIEDLRFNDCENLNDKLFQKLKFEKTRRLDVCRCPGIKGLDWNFLPNLKVCWINNCGIYGKEFFYEKKPWGENIDIQHNNNGDGF